MAEDDSFEERLTRKELENAANEVRALRGKPPLRKLPETPYCSICSGDESEAGPLFKGVEGYICMTCATEAVRVLRHAQK